MTSDVGLYATWEGTLTPISQPYRIWIRYVPERFLDTVTLQHSYVTVKVLDPLIAPDVRGTGEKTPHVYRYRQPASRPALCAWDPADEPFSPALFIADETVPAIIRWLVFFEDWLDTGTWRGGGKHPDPDAAVADVGRPKPDTGEPASPRSERMLSRAMGTTTSMMAIGRSKLGLFPSALDDIDWWFLTCFGRRPMATWPLQ
ncbi:hypothetical protein CN070_17020 [Sinorhizobium meliloti]|nr:hypothetical protein CN070_17020 [Sinorhizobium meliloti]